MRIYHIAFTILFLLSIDYCMAQQQKISINMHGEETTDSIYMKNGIPMIPIDGIFGVPELSIKTNNNKIKAYGKTYSLMEKPDIVNNRIFVSADFFPKVMNLPLCIDFVRNTIEAVDFIGDDGYDNVMLTEEYTLFIRKGRSFHVGLKNSDDESDIWKFVIVPNDGIELIDESTVPQIRHRSTDWIGEYYGAIGRDEKIPVPQSQRRKRDSFEKFIYKNWIFEAKKAGRFIFVFENAIRKTEFKVIVVNDN